MENKDLEIFDDLLDRYLRNQMTAKEEAQFKLLLASDPELKSRAKATALMIRQMEAIGKKNDRKIINTIKGMTEDEFRQVACEPEVNEPTQKPETTRHVKPVIRIWPKVIRYTTAACVVGFLGVGAYNYSLSNKAKILGGNSYDNLSLILNSYPRSATNENGDEIVDEAPERGTGFRTGGDQTELLKLETVFGDVQQGKNLKNAITVLESLYQESEDEYSDYKPFQDDIAWNLAIAYLKEGDRKKPIPLLQGIIDRNSEYPEVVEPAQKLIKQIKTL